MSASEVEAAARRALGEVSGELNALAQPLFDSALDHDTDGPLGGVPFLIKDSGPFARGVSFALGSRAIRGAMAQQDHELMSRFRRAGLAALGQTTAPELGLSFATESRLYGVTANPWDLARGAGGSSGGAAALVAAGAVPIAHGSDGAGSIRIPASCCGVVGLKPSRGRTTSGPDVPGGGLPMGVDFALTRTVRDTAALLDAVAAPAALSEPGSTAPAAPTTGYASLLSADPGRLRVGFTTRAWSEVPVDREVAEVTRTAAGVLDWIGHHVFEFDPPIDQESVVDAQLLAIHAAGRALLLAPRPTDPSLLEAVSRRVLDEARGVTDAGLAAAVDAQSRTTAAADSVFDACDLLLTPTLAVLPPRHGTLDYDDPRWTARGWVERILEIGPFTAVFNVSGHPAISLPLGESTAGLPIGVQLVAPLGREDLLLQVAAQFEQAMPWSGRQPSIFAA